LTDFGLSFSSDIEWESNRMYKTTPLIQAPETTESGISKETDIWAIGVVLYNILFNQWPWNSDGCSNLIEKICNNDLYFPDKAKHSPDAKELITKILQKNPKKRYTIHQILDHKWVKNLNITQQIKKESRKNIEKNNENYEQAEENVVETTDKPSDIKFMIQNLMYSVSFFRIFL
jgi:serine/threonine protein kinase